MVRRGCACRRWFHAQVSIEEQTVSDDWQCEATAKGHPGAPPPRMSDGGRLSSALRPKQASGENHAMDAQPELA